MCPLDVIRRFVHFTKKKVMDWEDYGIIPSIAIRTSNGDDDVAPANALHLARVYFSHLAGDSEFSDENVVMRDGRDFPFLTGVIQYRLTKDQLKSFLADENLVDEVVFAESILPRNVGYFNNQGKHLDELLREEVPLLLDEGESVEFNPPMMVPESADKFVPKYHMEDAGVFAAFSGINIDEIMTKFDIDDPSQAYTAMVTNFFMTAGVVMDIKYRVMTYEPNDHGLTLDEVARELHTTKAKASSIQIGWQDKGVLFQMAQEYDEVSYDGLNTVFLDILHGKGVTVVDGETGKEYSIDDRTVRDLRADRALLDEAIEQANAELPDAVYDVRKMNAELRRQYSVDKTQGDDRQYVSLAYEAFTAGGRRVQSVVDIEEIESIRQLNPNMWRRIEWGLDLREAYDNSENYADFMSSEEFIATNAITRARFDKLVSRGYLTLENPALLAMEVFLDEAEALSEFDAIYFSGRGKDWVTRTPQLVGRAELIDQAIAPGVDFDLVMSHCAELGVDLFERLVAYDVDGDTRYLVGEARSMLLSNPDVRNVRTRLFVDNYLDEAVQIATDRWYRTASETREFLGVDDAQLGRLIKRGWIEAGDIGLGEEIASLASQGMSERFSISATDIYASPGVYLEKMHGVTNLGDFVARTYSLDDIQRDLFGQGELADRVAKCCFDEEANPFNLIFLNVRGEQRVYVDDVKRMSAELQRGSHKINLKREVTSRLGVNKVPAGYGIEIPHNQSSEAIHNLSRFLNSFGHQCSDHRQGRWTVAHDYNVFRDDESYMSAVRAVRPGAVEFFGGSFHNSDIEPLANAIDSAQSSLNLGSRQSVVTYLERGLIYFTKDGFSTDQISGLVARSLTEDEILEISETLAFDDSLQAKFFKSGAIQYCPNVIIRDRMAEMPLSDISIQGIRILFTGNEWLTVECNSGSGAINYEDNYNARAESKIKYLMRTFVPNDKMHEAHEGSDVVADVYYNNEQLGVFSRIVGQLDEANVHNIAYFPAAVLKRDPQKCFLTKAEAATVYRSSVAEFDEAIKKHHVRKESVGGTEVYSLSGVVGMVKAKRKLLRTFSDTVDAYVASYMTLDRMKELGLELGKNAEITSFDEHKRNDYARALKMDNSFFDNILDEVVTGYVEFVGNGLRPNGARWSHTEVLRRGAEYINVQIHGK